MIILHDQIASEGMEETNGGRHSALGLSFTAIDSYANETIARILHEGAKSHNDPDGTNWRKVPVKIHLNHALYHINCFIAGDTSCDHLGHAHCRTMMALACSKEEPNAT